METWLKLSLLLCVFGFFKEIRPSEHFIYEYLSGPWRNITGEEVISEVYPVGTYGYLVLLVVVFLITDLLRYKPLIIVTGLSGIVFSSMLIWTTSLFSLQVMEIFYSIFMASEVAYYTYIYAKVDKEHYQAVTSHTRASLLFGRFLAGALSQVLVTYNLMDYKQLNYITLGAMVVATFWSFLLPSVQNTIYFHREDEEQGMISKKEKIKNGICLMLSEIKESYTNAYVIYWSLWYALGMACFLQVQVYMQPLWQAIIGGTGQTLYNGLVEAILTIFGFFAALLVGFIDVDWSKHGRFLLVFCSAFQGLIVIWAATTANVYICYFCYIIFSVFYHFAITVSSAEIAKKLKLDTFGLIFGFNTFVAMIFHSLLTVLVVNDVFGFALNIRQQYIVYGVFCFLIACVYFTVSVFWCLRRDRRQFQVSRDGNEV
ncbi:thiamine transporter 2-like [Coccinella septempunctata]|uniref:thiamine transporter 2-like n=1 Tax=Coccinella septempunctata TaxID=41139 RepID=UPI001D08F82F|nr:thiamine transporter 2-like [Coccinella septempunctata]